MLISEKTAGSIYFILFYFILFYFILFYFILFYFILFFASKEPYSKVRQLEKIAVKNAQAKVEKCAKQILGPLEPPPLSLKC